MARRRAGVFEAPSAVVSVQRVEPDTADTSAVWRELGETARGINRRLQPALNQYAEARAREDFAAGDIHQRTIWTEEDAAYNNAMAQSYLLRAEGDIEQRARDLETEHGLDAAAFDGAFQAARGEFIANAPPEFASHVGALLDREHLQARTRIGERRRAVAIQQLQQDGQARLETMEATLSGYTDLNSPEFAEAWRRYQSVGEALTANPLSGVFEEEWALRRDNTLARLQARTFIESGLSIYEDGGANAESAATAIEAARSLIYDPALTLTEAQREAALSDVRQAVTAAERERRARERELRADMREYRGEMREEARDLMTGVQARLSTFVVVPDAEMAELRRMVEASGSPALARQYNELHVENTVRQQMHGRTLVEVEAVAQAYADRAVAGGDGAGDAAVASAFARRYAQHLRTGNPLETARVHYGEPPPPVLTGQGVTEQSLGARVRHAERVAQELGVEEPTYLTPAERELFAGVARRGGEDALALARQIVSSSYSEEGDGFQRAQRILSEVAGRGGEALAAAGTTYMLGGEASIPAARYMLDAQRLRQVEGYVAPNVPGVSDDTWREQVLTTVLGGRAAGLTPQARSQVAYAAGLIFEGMVAEDGSRLRSYRQSYQSAVRMALGEVERGGQTYGGVVRDRGDHRIILPNWIRADQWQTLRGSMGLWDYAEGNGVTLGVAPNASVRDLRRAYMIWTGEPGRYWLAEEPDGTGHFETPSGEPYVLDLNRIRSRLAARRPDAVVR